MIKEIKDEWIARLRSGRYRQTREGFLKIDSRSSGQAEHCCLGVLCEIAYERGIVTQKSSGITFREDAAVLRSYLFNGNCAHLPYEVRHWAGVSSKADFSSSKYIGYTNLMMANDNGVSFSDIADIIEECF